jgi:hypothetical protein
VRIGAAAALGAFPVPEPDRTDVVAALRERMENDPMPSVRGSAARALGEFPVPEPDRTAVVGALRQRLEGDPDALGRYAAAGAFQVFAVPEPDRVAVVAALRARLQQDSDPFVRSAAAKTLGTFPVPEADRATIIAALLKRLDEDPFTGVRGAAVEALGSLAAPEPERRAIVAALLDRLEKDQFVDVRVATAVTLGAFAIAEPDRKKVVVTLLNRFERDQIVIVRSAAAVALGALAIPEPERIAVVASLRERAEKDTDPTVRNAAAASLVKFGPIGRDTLLTEWRAMYEGDARESSVWRAYAIASSGAPAWPDPAHVLLAFLGRPAPDSLPWQEVDRRPRQAAAYLKIFDDSWSEIALSEGLRSEAADRVIDIVRYGCPGSIDPSKSGNLIGQLLRRFREELGSAWRWLIDSPEQATPIHCWTSAEREVLTGLQAKLAHTGLMSQANELERAIDADTAPPLIGLISYGAVGWTLFWIGLIGAFPYSRQVRAVYLFNDKLRGTLSLWFVPLLLTLVPAARRHLLRPFRADLLRDARIESFDEGAWFPDSDVVDVRTGACMRLADALPKLAGVCLLVGESGLGKTFFLRRLAKRSRHALAFLHARACVDGVPEAVAQTTKGVQDARFFESMIYTGSLALIVDGLNEVSAEARGKILEFLKRNARDGNTLVATQPLEWGDKDGPAVAGARILELQPLDRAGMERFLLSRPVGLDPTRKVHGPEYQTAVEEFLHANLDASPSPEESAAARLVLSNPMDLFYASELIAAGLMPRPTEMVGQAFRLAEQHYLNVEKREFPTAQFAKRVVELRLADRNWLDPGEFANEQPTLENYRLLVRTTIRDQDGNEESRARFRHDKVVDFFLKLAFDNDPALQLAHFDDPRFRGVYLLYAQTAPIDIARRLRDQLVRRAATTRDHTLSDEFVRRLSLRDTDNDGLAFSS